eukprot:s142_g8.t1
MRPNLVTFNGYLSALQKAARWEQAISPELGSDLGALDVPACGAQVAACAAARSWMQVAALLRELRKRQLQADSWMQQWTVYSLAQRGLQIHSSFVATPQALDVLRAAEGDLATWRQSENLGAQGGKEEEQHLTESQDALYVNMREQIDKKAIQKRSEQLHFLEAEKPNRHTLFVDEDDLEEPQKPGGSSSSSTPKKLKDFDVAGYFDTHPALLKRKANRLRLKQLQTKEIKTVEDVSSSLFLVDCLTQYLTRCASHWMIHSIKINHRPRKVGDLLRVKLATLSGTQ